MRWLLITTALLGTQISLVRAESDLLNSVKRNPGEAQALCRSFEKMNSKGKSAYSKKSTQKVARNRNLSFQDAEILVTYVAGMYCPDVR